MWVHVWVGSMKPILSVCCNPFYGQLQPNGQLSAYCPKCILYGGRLCRKRCRTSFLEDMLHSCVVCGCMYTLGTTSPQNTHKLAMSPSLTEERAIGEKNLGFSWDLNPRQELLIINTSLMLIPLSHCAHGRELSGTHPT